MKASVAIVFSVEHLADDADVETVARALSTNGIHGVSGSRGVRIVTLKALAQKEYTFEEQQPQPQPPKAP